MDAKVPEVTLPVKKDVFNYYYKNNRLADLLGVFAKSEHKAVIFASKQGALNIAQQLIVTCIHGELDAAMWLWKRSTQKKVDLRNESSKLTPAWKIIQALHNQEYADFYRLAASDNGPEMNFLQAALVESTRQRLKQKISKAYQSINRDICATQFGMSVEGLADKCLEWGWKTQGEWIYPLPEKSVKPQATKISQLEQLSSFVIDLES